MRRILAVLALLAGSFVAVSPAAQAVPCAGVAVKVDFASLGGGVVTKCFVGDPATGLEALRKHFTVGFVPRQPGFVCTIDAKPNPCTMPTTSAYWSYWHGTPGGTWTYSTSGAGSYNPAPGTVEGWAFGAGVAPSTAP